MNILVVYDSFFGNTEAVAQAIADSVRGGSGGVVLRQVDAVTAGDLAGLDLLIVGSPTRSFAPSPAVQAWLKSLPHGSLQGVRAAAFDTRFPQDVIAQTPPLPFFVRLVGPSAWAATHIARLLKKAGAVVIAPPEGFYVGDTEGPLLDAETDRAAAWGRGVMAGKPGDEASV